MTKTIYTLTAFLYGSAAFAGPFGLPAHEKDGYRDTGCDPAFQVDLGGYSNNPTCKDIGGGGFDVSSVSVVVQNDDPQEDDEEDEDDNGGETVEDDNGGETVEDPEDDGEVCRGDCNNGHGNDEDGHDESNPGKGKGKK